MEDDNDKKPRKSFWSWFDPDLSGDFRAYAKRRSESARTLAGLFVHFKLIPPDHPAVKADQSFPMVRLVWATWQLLDLHPGNWRRILIFGSFAVPWVVMWVAITAFVLHLIVGRPASPAPHLVP